MCIYESAIERFNDEQSNKREMEDFKIVELRKCMKYLINIQMEITQCIGICKSAYTKGYAPNCKKLKV